MTRWMLLLWISLAASPVVAGGLTDEQAYKYSEAVNEAARYGRSGNYRRAFDAYEKALQYNPEAADVYFNLVAIGDAMKLFDKVCLYARGYLAVAGEGSNDGRDVLAKLNTARKQVGGLGKLSVTSDPGGAVVTVNGAYLGSTPLADVELPAGSYKVTATQRDFHPATVDAKIRLDAPTALNLKLDEILYYGTIVVTTKPEAGVAVYLDDAYIGTTPLAEPMKAQANREHVIRLDLKGFDTWTRAVVVAPDKPTTIEATLETPVTTGPADEPW